MTFADSILLAKKRNLLTSKEISNKLGISYGYYWRLESGKEPPTVYVLKSAIRCGFITEDEKNIFINELKPKRARRA